MTLVNDGTAYANHGILIAKTQDNSAAYNWKNTIDVVWATGAPPAYGDPIVTAWTNFLKGIQRDDCSIVEVSLYPYVKGRQPLANQGAIWQASVNIPCKDWGAGTAHPPATSSLSAPLGEVCVAFIKGKFGQQGGRSGRMFIRNAVPQEALKNVAGGPPLLDPTTSGTTVAEWNAWASGNLAAYCTASPLPRYCLIHAQKLTQTPPAHDIFDGELSVPAYERLTTNNITRANKK